MKIFLKILFFIFTMIITVGEAKSSTVVNLSQKTTVCWFQKTESIIVSFVFENYSEKYCVKEEKVVSCNERGKERETVAAKGGVGRTVDFVAGVEARSFDKVVGKGTVHIRPTINAIEKGSLMPRNAGYLNIEMHPQLLGYPTGYWQEYHLLEFGSKSPLRILRGGNGEYYLSPNHYKSIISLNC